MALRRLRRQGTGSERVALSLAGTSSTDCISDTASLLFMLCGFPLRVRMPIEL